MRIIDLDQFSDDVEKQVTRFSRAYAMAHGKEMRAIVKERIARRYRDHYTRRNNARRLVAWAINES